MARQTILGAGGTIGAVLAKELRKYTGQVRLVSRNPHRINAEDEIFAADLTDAGQVKRAIAGSEVVYLVVGFDYSLKVWRRQWPPLMQACIDGCLAAGAKLVFFDNVYLYQKSAVPHMTEDSTVDPPSGKGKVRAEIVEMLWRAVNERKLEALVARAADFYGPDNQKSYLIEAVYKNLRQGRSARWFSNAQKKHSFTYTPDAARATALLGNTPAAFGQTWHLPTFAPPLTGEEWVRLMAARLNVKPSFSVVPAWMIRLLGLFIPFMREMPEMLYQYEQDYFFDSSKFMARFPGFRITPPMEAVQVIVAADGKTSERIS
jgi:nucleoside-diphosphate-sugar epimerase